jgi:hypothetical protein
MPTGAVTFDQSQLVVLDQDGSGADSHSGNMNSLVN